MINYASCLQIFLIRFPEMVNEIFIVSFYVKHEKQNFVAIDLMKLDALTKAVRPFSLENYMHE